MKFTKTDNSMKIAPLGEASGFAKKQRGMSLIQALFVLVLGGIALSVALNQYQSGEKSSRVQKNIGDVMEIIGSVKSNYGQYSFKNLTTAIAVGSGVVPKRLADTTTTAKNDFGGAIDLVDNNATKQGTALLTYALVPTEMCTQLVTGTSNAARMITVNAVPVKPAYDADLDISLVNTNCTGGATVPITWTVGRT